MDWSIESPAWGTYFALNYRGYKFATRKSNWTFVKVFAKRFKKVFTFYYACHLLVCLQHSSRAW